MAFNQQPSHMTLHRRFLVFVCSWSFDGHGLVAVFYSCYLSLIAGLALLCFTLSVFVDAKFSLSCWVNVILLLCIREGMKVWYRWRLRIVSEKKWVWSRRMWSDGHNESCTWLTCSEHGHVLGRRQTELYRSSQRKQAFCNSYAETWGAINYDSGESHTVNSSPSHLPPLQLLRPASTLPHPRHNAFRTTHNRASGLRQIYLLWWHASVHGCHRAPLFGRQPGPGKRPYIIPNGSGRTRPRNPGRNHEQRGSWTQWRCIVRAGRARA